MAGIAMRMFSEADYTALGRTLLHGQAPPNHLAEELNKIIAATPPSQWIKTAESDQRPVLAFFRPLCVWYRAVEEMTAGRLKPDSRKARTMEGAMHKVTAIILPRVVRALVTGNYEWLSQLAAVVEAAQAVARSKNPADMRRAESRLLRDVGLKGPKVHKRTERLQTLLPLWSLGMGRLPYITQCKILDSIGLAESEIPTDDALRKMLSYHRLAQAAKRIADGDGKESRGRRRNT